jgi:hypothetical protein
MRVNLRTLKPNPIRNFKLDPIDEEIVERLVQSIKQDEFWGGIVCCKGDREIYVIAGQHRVEAALRAGLTHADVFVAPAMDVETMVRIYSRENATQRGNSSVARIGSVAAALRIVALNYLRSGEVSQPGRGTEQQLGEKGIGWRPILDFLQDVPGFTEHTVKQDLAVIKASGSYAEIIASARDEIAREAEEARIEAEQAERERQEAEERGLKAEAEVKKKAGAEARKKAEDKAKAKAKAENAARAATDADKGQNRFDFEGVSQYLKTPHQIDAFRKIVTSPGIAPRLPVDQQAPLAKELVRSAAYLGHELSAQWIREQISYVHLQDATIFRVQKDKEAMRQARLADLRTDSREAQREFTTSVWRLSRHGKGLLEVMDRFKKEKESFVVGWDLEHALRHAYTYIVELCNRLSGRTKSVLRDYGLHPPKAIVFADTAADAVACLLKFFPRDELLSELISSQTALPPGVDHTAEAAAKEA